MKEIYKTELLYDWVAETTMKPNQNIHQHD